MKIQLTLMNVLLLVTAVAFGVSHWRQCDRNAGYESQLPGLRDAARKLVVDDATLLHAVNPHPQWYGEKKWKIHVPDEGSFWLHAVTEDIPYDPDTDDLSGVDKSFQLTAGLHEIELETSIAKESSETHKVAVIVDGTLAMPIEKNFDWRPQSCSTSSSSDVTVSKSFARGANVELIQRKFRKSNTRFRRNAQFNGIQLWISEEPGSDKE